MNEKQIEELLYAFDIIRVVKADLENAKNKKRVINRLDKALTEIQIVIENERKVSK